MARNGIDFNKVFKSYKQNSVKYTKVLRGLEILYFNFVLKNDLACMEWLTLLNIQPTFSPTEFHLDSWLKLRAEDVMLARHEHQGIVKFGLHYRSIDEQLEWQKLNVPIYNPYLMPKRVKDDFFIMFKLYYDNNEIREIKLNTYDQEFKFLIGRFQFTNECYYEYLGSLMLIVIKVIKGTDQMLTICSDNYDNCKENSVVKCKLRDVCTLKIMLHTNKSIAFKVDKK